MLYKRLIINGKEYLLAVSQAGSGAPTATTPGAPGLLYMDTDTGDLYKCRSADAVNEVYTWEKIGGGNSDYKLPIGGEQLGGVKNGGNVVINEDGTMNAPDSSQNADKLAMKSPDGTVWNITVSNNGVITATRADGGETVTYTIPVVNLTGTLTGISGDDYVNVICHYLDSVNSVEFTDYAEIAYQGSSSMDFTNVEDGVDKAKNYKIKLYTDEARESKSKRVFKDWFATNNFHIKANYGDCTNFMNNMMMHYLTKSYQYLTPLPRDGARYTVDGFPVLLYINGVFCGIRFWNLKQDDKVYGLRDENDLCYQIGLNNGSSSGDNSGSFIYGNLNSGSNAGKNFADAHAEIDYYWEDRVWDKTSNHPAVLYDTIQWVSEATNDEFKANLQQYFDKEYLINYFVMMYTCGMGDSICKNFNMLYFPDKGKWYATFWDMDFAWGTGWGLATTSYTIDVLSSTYGASRLFTKLWANFADEIKAKYWELRETVLTVEQVEDSINAVWGDITAEMIADNYTAKYNGTGGFKTNGVSYVKTWVANRLAHIDAIMSIAGDEPVLPEISISAGYINDSGELTAMDGSFTRDDYTVIDSTESLVSVKVSAQDDGMVVRIAEYDENKTFVKRHYNPGTGDWCKSGMTARYVFEPDENTRFVRIGVSGADNADTAETLLKTAVIETAETVELAFEAGEIDSNGNEINANYWQLRSETVEVDSETLTGWNASGMGIGFRCYNSDGAFAGIPTHHTSAGLVDGGLFNTQAPTGTVKVRILLINNTVGDGAYILLNGKKYIPVIST